MSVRKQKQKKDWVSLYNSIMNTKQKWKPKWWRWRNWLALVASFTNWLQPPSCQERLSAVEGFLEWPKKYISGSRENFEVKSEGERKRDLPINYSIICPLLTASWLSLLCQRVISWLLMSVCAGAPQRSHHYNVFLEAVWSLFVCHHIIDNSVDQLSNAYRCVQTPNSSEKKSSSMIKAWSSINGLKQGKFQRWFTEK